MTKLEYIDIILKSSKHYTKHDYYERKRPKGCPRLEYAKALLEIHEILEKDLNEPDLYNIHIVYTTDVDQFKKGDERDIRLLDKEDVEFYKSVANVMYPFKKSRLINGVCSDMYNGPYYLADLLKTKAELYSYCSEILGSERPKGFKSKLELDNQKKLFAVLKDRKAIDSTEENFIAILTCETVPTNFIPVKWILSKGKESVHKGALMDFLNFAVDDSEIPFKTNKKFPTLICDLNNKPIDLANPTSMSSAWKKISNDLKVNDLKRN